MMQGQMLTETAMTTRLYAHACASARVLAGIALTVGASYAHSERSATQSQYEKDRAVCVSGSSNQDRVTCLKEAGAARDAAKHGQLVDADAASYKKNSLDRCKVLTGDDARDCITRMNGGGTASGSVESGGLYRESVTTQVKPAAPTARPASAPE